MTAPGWRPLEKPVRRLDPTPAVVTPFTRFARAHTVAAVGDGLITIALAGSIFFSVDPSAARQKVALYLFLTIAPFAVVTPLIGPAVDRAAGGRRTLVLATAFGRAVVAFLMAGHIDSLLLFPEAFAMLVLQKAYVISNRAMVPKLVNSNDRLVEANSKLALLTSVGSMGGAAFGAILAFVGGPGWAAGFAFLVFLAAGVVALAIPSQTVADEPADAEERAELRGSGIVLASTAMGVLRAIVGFMTFLLAFEFRGGKEGVDIEPLGAAAGAGAAVLRGADVIGDPRAPAWHFGAVVLAAGLGALAGARIAPALRRTVPEERILLGVLVATALVGGFAVINGALLGAFLLSGMVAVAAGAGKLGFDSLVQRDAPDANYGRSFARFEARFQLLWVVGAFLPVVITMPARLGFFLVTAAAAGASISYVVGVRAAGRQPAPRAARADLVADEGEPWVFDPSARPAAPAPSPTDPTTVMRGAVDPTAHLPGSPTTVADSPAEPAPPPPAPPPEHAGWGTPAAPVISAGEGVEIDPAPPARRDA